MNKILVYGCILFDQIDSSYYIGGCNTNVAGHASKLGLDTYMVSCVGTDSFGETALSWMNRNHIHTDFIGTTSEAATGTVEVDVSNPTDPQYILSDPAAYDRISLSELQFDTLRRQEFDFFYFSTTEQRHEDGISAATLHQLLDSLNVKYRFFDANLRKNCFSDSLLHNSLQKTDILKVNEEELFYLGEHVLHSLKTTEAEIVHSLLANYKIQIIIVTKGGAGACAYSSTEMVSVPSSPVHVIDTIGAGDAFSAAFMAAYLTSGSLKQAVEAGNLLGGYVAGKRSAIPDYTPAIQTNLNNYLRGITAL